MNANDKTPATPDQSTHERISLADTTEAFSPDDAELSQAELDQAAGGRISLAGKEDAAVQRVYADEGKSDRQY